MHPITRGSVRLPERSAAKTGNLTPAFATTAELEAQGKPIGSSHTMIAAHALALDLTLVTDNEREFRRVYDLRIENWTK